MTGIVVSTDEAPEAGDEAAPEASAPDATAAPGLLVAVDDRVSPQDELDRETEERCGEAFESVDLQGQPEVLPFCIYPSPDTWAAGDREVICVAQSDDGLVGSVID